MRKGCGEDFTMRNFKVCTVSNTSIVRVIKYRRLKWADHVVRIEEGRNAFKILTGTPTTTT